MPERAYALREDAKETFSDATTTAAGGKTLKVGALLEEGDGVIVTSDSREQAALDRVSVLKSVDVPKKNKPKSGATADAAKEEK